MPRTSDADVRLLAASLDLIWRRSYHAAAVEDICTEAQVRKGIFYHFFASKEDLAGAALEAEWQRRKAAFDEAFSRAISPLERIFTYFRCVTRWQRESRRRCGRVLGCPIFCLGIELGAQPGVLGEKVRKILDQQVGYFERAIRDAHRLSLLDAPDARPLARRLFALYQGTLAQARITNRTSLLVEMQKGVAEMLNGRAVKPGRRAVGAPRL